VFFYLEDRERTLDSPTDKLWLSVTAFADELEREKARQRTHDAMLRKAKAGQVTGGRLWLRQCGRADRQARSATSAFDRYTEHVYHVSNDSVVHGRHDARSV
jgi:DNA invertase Pin-like site-specific DNA recombinase